MHCKSYSHFFSKTLQHICVSLDVNFNESLTNDIGSFEQLGQIYLFSGMVDTIFADVAQPDQARIVAINAHNFLKNGGHVVISIKVCNRDII